MLKIVNDAGVEGPSGLEDGVDLDELCRMAAQEMLAIALETERRAYLDAHAGVVDSEGHRMVVGNGDLPSWVPVVVPSDSADIMVPLGGRSFPTDFRHGSAGGVPALV